MGRGTGPWQPVWQRWRQPGRLVDTPPPAPHTPWPCCAVPPQVKIWRRSYDVPPLEMDSEHAYYEAIQKDPRYADIPEAELPKCESLKLTIERSLPYWNEKIAPKLKEGKKLLIAAHGNSLRGIVKHLEGLTYVPHPLPLLPPPEPGPRPGCGGHSCRPPVVSGVAATCAGLCWRPRSFLSAGFRVCGCGCVCSREKGGPAVPQARAARGVCTLCVCVSRARSLFSLADGTVPPHTHTLLPPTPLLAARRRSWRSTCPPASRSSTSSPCPT